MEAPMITPEQQEMMMQQQQEQQAQQQMQAPAQQQQPVDEVQMAKEALGLDAYEQELQAMKAQLQESKEKAVFEEVSKKYDDIDPTLVQKELEKLAETKPQIAEALKADPDGLDMLFAKVKSSMQPEEKPDEITDSGSSGGNESSDFNKKVEKGTASEIDLGDFILGASKE